MGIAVSLAVLRLAIISLVLLYSVSAAANAPAPSRHHLGLQLGGTGLFQLAYRLRLFGRVYADAGVFAAPHVGNGSLGVVVEPLRYDRWSLYLGAGVGGASAQGDVLADERCNAESDMCEWVASSYIAGFIYGRVGVSLHFGQHRNHRVGIDAGLWRGVERKREEQVITDETRFTIPMAGVSYLYAL